MELTAGKVKELLFKHGDLHDCRVINVAWSLSSNRLEVSVVDLNANFAGLPGYSGPQPGRLILDGILSIQVDGIPASDRIYETLLSVEEGSLTVEILFSPAGKLVVHATAVSIVKNGNE